jgi:putative DNA methylase
MARDAEKYADAIAIYLALAVDKVADYGSSMVMWSPTRDQAKTTFARNAIPMIWDFAEINPFAGAAGDLITSLGGVVRSVSQLGTGAPGFAVQADAQSQRISTAKVISTDPPYFDNIGYSDLSDFFYTWLRPSLESITPELFSTVTVPKSEELVATPSRHGGKECAQDFFMAGMKAALGTLAESSRESFPVSIYYAFKQSDSNQEGTVSTGWETFLEAAISAGFSVTGTWPIRTEREVRSRSIDSNALASSVVLICQKRGEDAGTISRRELQRQLRAELPEALETMIGGRAGEISPIAPVDLAQAAIGPGMAVYSRFAAVLEADGSPMSVRDALILINRVVDEYFNEAGEELDADTRFCIDWFSTHGWKTGKFGEADTLARAKGTSVEGVQEAGVVEAGGGKVRLLRWKEYPTDWDPETDKRLPTWEGLHHLIRALNENGEAAAGQLLAHMPERGESLRQLAYRLYTLCERKKWAEDARAYNEIIQAWGRVVEESASVPPGTQAGLDI